MNLESELRPNFEPIELLSGVDDETLGHLMAQACEFIEEERRKHPGVMLSQKPEELMTQFRAGRSSVIINDQNLRAELIAHGTIWPLSEVEGIFLGEIGSVIVAPKHRDRKYSERIVMNLLNGRENSELLIITTKDIRMGRALSKGGLIPVDFARYLAICRTTCICSSLDEYGNCGSRRSSQESSGEIFEEVFSSGQRNPDTIIDCTLFISNPELAERFEEASRR